MVIFDRPKKQRDERQLSDGERGPHDQVLDCPAMKSRSAPTVGPRARFVKRKAGHCAAFLPHARLYP